MDSMNQENGNIHNNQHHPSSKEIVLHGNPMEIAEIMMNEKVIEPGSHNLLIYKDLKTLREMYSHFSKALLPQNEMIAIGTQYDSIEVIKNTLRLAGGIDVEGYQNQGILFILDAQETYQSEDPRKMWKLVVSLLSRAKKEGRRGLTGFADLGSFFSFEKLEELMRYELWLPQKNEEDTMKIVCCYHSKNFEKLTKAQQQTLIDHHAKSILTE